MNPLDHIDIPDFKEFIRIPSNELCQIIDATRLKVEILWWMKHASVEFEKSSYSNKVIIDGGFAFVMRYKREWDNTYRPACSIGYDVDDAGRIVINQVQGSKDGHIAFRVHSSFNTSAYILKLLEESFLKKGIPVYMKPFPTGMEYASHASKSIERYRVLQSALIGLNTKYFPEAKKA